MNMTPNVLLNATAYQYYLPTDDGKWTLLGKVVKQTKKCIWIDEGFGLVKYILVGKEDVGYEFKSSSRFKYNDVPYIFNFALDPLIQFTLGYNN